MISFHHLSAVLKVMIFFISDCHLSLSIGDVICKAMNWYIYFKILQPIKLVELRVQLLNFFGMIKHYQI